MTKRKSSEDEEQASSESRKGVAFSTPEDAAAKATMAENASASPLLQLPLEIRNIIWAGVLGDRLIHIDDHSDLSDEFRTEIYGSMRHSMHYSGSHKEYFRNPWRHVVCKDDCSEHVPGPRRVIRDRDGVEHTYWPAPHQSCNTYYELQDPALPFDFYNHETMRLTVLRSCRQVYGEANQILWATNTFSFQHPMAFKRFLIARKVHQKRLIQKLRFELDWEFRKNVRRWDNSLTVPVIHSLSGLRTLRLQIEYKMKSKFDNTLANGRLFPEQSRFHDGIWMLSILPLTNVEIAVRPSSFRIQSDQWTESDEKEFADRLRRMLLNPKGPEVYTEVQQLQLEILRKLKEEEEALKS
ncbi:MAG: hypothetical protein Q9181_006564 [Wetmoreana brouardii]